MSQLISVCDRIRAILLKTQKKNKKDKPGFNFKHNLNVLTLFGVQEETKDPDTN